jgi:hypothetical protein
VSFAAVEKSVKQMEEAITTLNRAADYIHGQDSMHRRPSPETADLIAYEFTVGTLLAGSLGALLTSVCNLAEGIDPLLTELERLVASEPI